MWIQINSSSSKTCVKINLRCKELKGANDVQN